MTPDRWAQAKTIFGAAIEIDPARREAYVREVCGADRELLQEVMSLLHADSTETIFHNPLAGSAGPPLLKERYRVEREIGRGGLGVVYLARDEALHGRPVVIKMLLDPRPGDPWVTEKFAQEVKALALLNHPGVVGALDHGVSGDGRHFFVMQYIEGRPLQAAIQPEGIPLEQAGHLLRQIGHALAAAHAKDIWHRDLKPANIMLQKLEGGHEHVRLIDFGIATVKAAPGDQAGTRIAGTPPYMAPEQLVGRVSAATDIFAMGVIAYELVTGRKPFASDNPVELHELHQAGAVKPSQLRPGLPAAAEKLILQALSFRAEARPRNAGEFGEALARALNSPEPRVEKPSRRNLMAVGLAAAAMVLAAAWWKLAPHADASSITWSLMVVPAAGAPAAPVKTGSPLRASDQFFLLLRAPQGGYVYLLSDDATNDTFNFLGSFQLRAGEQNSIPAGRPFVFDQPGVFHLQCVWSRDTLRELEPLGRLLNERDRGIVGDRAERTAVRRFLSKLPQLTPVRSQSGLEQTVSASAPQMAWRLRVEAK